MSQHGINAISTEISRWEKFLKRTVLSTNSVCVRVTIATAMSTQSDRVNQLLLHEIFPVLKNARVSNDGLRVQLITHDDFRMDVAVSFETQAHGLVTFIGASVDDDLMNRARCNMQFRMTNDGPAFVMTNYGDLDDTHMYCITMVVPYTPCYFCKEVPKKLWKCSKCWSDLRFPVRYCCKKCQVLDFPTHRRVCGANFLG